MASGLSWLGPLPPDSLQASRSSWPLSFFGRTTHHTQAAALSGMAQSIGHLGAALGPVVIGLLNDATRAWQPALTVLLGVQLCLVVLGYLAGRDRVIG